MAWTPEQRLHYARAYRDKHKNDPEWKVSMRTRQRRRRHKVKRKLIDLLGGKCSRCGFNEHIHALEFDHINPQTKQYEPSYLISSGSYQRAADYITVNCRLLCGNCHALKSVAFADQSRGNGVCDTTEERELYEKGRVIV